MEAVRAPLRVRICQHLGVAARGEAVAELFELVRELDVVVDLAVLDDPEAPLIVGEGLVAQGKVDDCEAARREAQSAVQVETGSVRAAVSKLAGHR